MKNRWKKNISVLFVKKISNHKWAGCGHEFHEPCAQEWKREKHTCPIYRHQDTTVEGSSEFQRLRDSDEYQRPRPHQDPSFNVAQYNYRERICRELTLLSREFENNHRNRQSAGNKCAVCNRGIHFSEFTRDSNETCEECMIQESLQMSQSANQRQNDNILNPEHQNVPRNARNRSPLRTNLNSPNWTERRFNARPSYEDMEI